MTRALFIALLSTVLGVGVAGADQGDFAAELRSIAEADAIIAAKVADRRAELEATLALAYRSLRGRGMSHFGGSRTRARGWWRRLIHLRQTELRALHAELANVRNNRASYERDEQRRFARPSRRSLTAPVKGPVAHRFGPYRHSSGARLRRRGMSFRATQGGPVAAPAAGRIRYAGPIRGLGPGVILGSDEGWWIVVGGVRVDSERVGRSVAAGDELGTAASGRVYLEVRVGPGGGTAVDPGPLLR